MKIAYSDPNTTAENVCEDSETNAQQMILKSRIIFLGLKQKQLDYHFKMLTETHNATQSCSLEFESVHKNSSNYFLS